MLLGRLGREARVEIGSAHHVDHVEPGQHQARENGGGIHLDHRDGGGRGVDDQHDRGRDQDAQTAAGANHAGRELGIVAGLQERREGEQAHQGDHGADDADGGGEQGAGRQRRHRHGAGDPARRDIEAVEQPVDDVGPFDDVPHEQEQRHRDQHVAHHHRVGLVHEQVEDVVVQDVGAGAVVGVETEADAHGDQSEGDGEAEQDGEQKHPQHQEGDLGIGHLGPPALS